MDIERPEEIKAFLLKQNLAVPEENLKFEILHGGVSNRTVLVRRSTGVNWVLKQALEKLRVETEWYSSTDRIHQEASALKWLTQIIPNHVPSILLEDKTYHILGMTAVPTPHTNWKTDLMSGIIDFNQVAMFAELLAEIHAATKSYPELALDFKNHSFFESLRLEPYYSFTATQVPEATDYLYELIAETKTRKFRLVHGDYSPKNVLIHQHQMFILDYEVMHIGDPAFDLGFSITHFLSKAHALPAFRSQFFQAAMLYWDTYIDASSGQLIEMEFEQFAIKHTLACMLARVCGRSPLEYLKPPERDLQKKVILEILASPPGSMRELVSQFESLINH